MSLYPEGEHFLTCRALAETVPVKKIVECPLYLSAPSYEIRFTSEFSLTQTASVEGVQFFALSIHHDEKALVLQPDFVILLGGPVKMGATTS